MTKDAARGGDLPSLPDLGEAPAWQASRWFNTAEPLELDGLRGRVVLMHAFQMLCPGCVSHGVPQAERVHRRFGAHGVVVVGFHTVFEHHEAMTPVALAAFLHEYRVTHPVAVDLPVAGHALPATMAAYDMQGTPTTILLDRDGRIRLQSLGGVDDLELGLLIGRLLGR